MAGSSMDRPTHPQIWFLNIAWLHNKTICTEEQSNAPNKSLFADLSHGSKSRLGISSLIIGIAIFFLQLPLENLIVIGKCFEGHQGHDQGQQTPWPQWIACNSRPANARGTKQNTDKINNKLSCRWKLLIIIISNNFWQNCYSDHLYERTLSWTRMSPLHVHNGVAALYRILNKTKERKQLLRK